MGLYQTKKVLHSKKNYQQNEKATEWEKILAKHISDEELVVKIYKAYNSIAKKQPIKKTDNLNRHCSKADTDRQQVPEKKKGSIPVIIREIQTKTTVRYHLTLVRLPLIKKDKKSKVLERM